MSAVLEGLSGKHHRFGISQVGQDANSGAIQSGCQRSVALGPLSELAADIADLEINGPGLYGFEPLQQAIAAHSRVSADCVVAASGTSMANFIAMAAVVQTQSSRGSRKGDPGSESRKPDHVRIGLVSTTTSLQMGFNGYGMASPPDVE